MSGREKLLENVERMKKEALRFINADSYVPFHVEMWERWSHNDEEEAYVDTMKCVFSLREHPKERVITELGRYVPSPCAECARITVIGALGIWPVWYECVAGAGGLKGGENRLPWLYDNYMEWGFEGMRGIRKTNEK